MLAWNDVNALKLETNGFLNAKDHQECQEVSKLLNSFVKDLQEQEKHGLTYQMAPHRFWASMSFGSKQASYRRCISSNERAHADCETSPALALVFSSPIMNSDTVRD